MKEKRRRRGLPFKRVLLMSLAGLKHKTIRLIISILLAVIAFSFVGFSLTVTNSDVVGAELKECYAEGVSVVLLSPDSEQYSSRLGRYLDVSTFTNSQTEAYESATGKEIIGAYILSVYDANPYANSPEESSYSIQSSSNESLYDSLIIQRFDAVVELNSDTTEEDLAITPDPRLAETTECRLPSNIYEIAITDLKADFYIKYGYMTDDGEEVVIETPDDLIGKTLDGFTIVGIYSTTEDCEDLKQITKDSCGERKYSYYVKGYHVANFAFLYEGYETNESIYGSNAIYGSGSLKHNIYYKLSGSLSTDKALIKKMTYTEAGYSHILTDTYSVCLSSPYSGFSRAAQNYLADEVIMVAYVVAVIFMIISILLTANFMMTSHEERKREFGILRALGAKTGDVTKICLVEGLAIALIEFVLSLVATGVISAILNVYFFIPVFFMGVIPILAVFLLSIGVTALGVISPTVKLSRKKPIDIINGS
ncbi:MAG: FtsX-like permease family protein [Clostridia bacterium]|nr:FtsX-like permease family protein [Clostridia bacterium]